MQAPALLPVLVFLLSVLPVAAHTRPANARAADTLTVELSGVEVTQRKPLKVLTQDGHPAYRLTAEWVDGMPQFMGNADPVRIMQSLPAVATSSELTTGMFIQGCGDSQNRYEIDGAPVINPSHMLGLLSTFNGAHFADYALTPTGHGAASANCIGGQVQAHTPATPDTAWHATASVGIISAQASVKAPIVRGSNTLALSLRQTYIDLLFPTAIKMDHAVLKYGFTDLNATFVQRVGATGTLRANVFFSRDNMHLDDTEYDSSGRFGWENIVCSAGYDNATASHVVAFTRYHNRFYMREGAMDIRMPSAINVLSYRGKQTFARHWVIAAEATARMVDEQLPLREDRTATSSARSSSFEGSVAAEWSSRQWGIFSATAGVRATIFCNGGFSRAYPMPRLAMKLRLPNGLTVDASAGLYTQCAHMVKESNTGLPCDFWINASRRFRPQTARAAALSLSGRLPLDLAFRLEGYYRRMSHLLEYTGSIFNLINRTGSPLDEVATGNGNAYGLSVTLMRVYGPVQGWIGYNIGASKVHIPALDNGYFPANHDRRHDLTATVNWRLSHRLSLAANFVYASGTPYTQAKYGYMIGENLVCEYYPHNSSRLPDYKRLDLSLNWTLSTGRVRQKLNVSLYNALFSKNIIFTYPTYSSDKGLSQSEVGLKTLIPSVSYTISL